MTDEMVPLTLTQPLDQASNPAMVYLASLTSKTGRASQAQVVRVIAQWLGGTPDTVGWSGLRYAHCIAIRTQALNAEYAPASVRKFLSALRGILKNAWRLGQISADDYQRATDIPSVQGSTLPAGRYITKAEIDAMMIVCIRDLSHSGSRDAAILATMYYGALRRAEVVNLDMADYNRETGRLVVHGKRNKERVVFISNGAMDAMNDWLDARGDHPGALFLAVNNHNTIRARDRMNSQAIYNMITKRSKQVAVDHISPHDLRRTSISDQLNAGIDLVTVSKIAGHSNPQTTASYDRRPEEAKKEAAGRLEIYHEPRKKEVEESVIRRMY